MFDLLVNENFYVSTNKNNSYAKILAYLINGINPRIKIQINCPSVPEDKMKYCIGDHETLLGNNYMMTASVDNNIQFINKPTFIISVRGIISREIIQQKFKINPLVGDILLLFNKYFPKNRIVKYKYCFIYDNKFTCIWSKNQLGQYITIR